MNRTLLSRYLTPVLGVVLLNLVFLFGLDAWKVTDIVASGYSVLVSNPAGEHDIDRWVGMDFQAALSLRPRISGVLTIVSAVLLLPALWLLVRHWMGKSSPRVERLFWICVIVQAYAIFIGLLLANYFLVTETYRGDQTALLLAIPRPAAPVHLIYPALLIAWVWLAGWKSRGQFIREEHASAIANLSGGAGNEGSPPPASRSILGRVHPALGLIALSAVMISYAPYSAFYAAFALVQALASAFKDSSIGISTYVYIGVPLGLLGIAAWLFLLGTGLLLSARAMIGKEYSSRLERAFWLIARLMAYLTLIGMYLFIAKPLAHYPNIYYEDEAIPVPGVTLFIAGILCFVWLGTRRLRKRAVTPEQAAWLAAVTPFASTPPEIPSQPTP